MSIRELIGTNEQTDNKIDEGLVEEAAEKPTEEITEEVSEKPAEEAAENNKNPLETHYFKIHECVFCMYNCCLFCQQ